VKVSISPQLGTLYTYTSKVWTHGEDHHLDTDDWDVKLVPYVVSVLNLNKCQSSVDPTVSRIGDQDSISNPGNREPT
jgi:hypothetical protein